MNTDTLEPFMGRLPHSLKENKWLVLYKEKKMILFSIWI
jgi:hypothetical protein